MEILNVSTARELWCRKVIGESRRQSWNGNLLAWFSETGMREAIIREAASRFISENNEPRKLGVFVVRSFTENEKTIDVQSFMYNIEKIVPRHLPKTIEKYVQKWKADHQKNPRWELPPECVEPGIDNMDQLSTCVWFCLGYTKARSPERCVALSDLGKYITWFMNKNAAIDDDLSSLDIITANITRQGTPFDSGFEGIMSTRIPYKTTKETNQ